MLMFIKLQYFQEGSGAINTLITRGHKSCHNPGLLFTLLTVKTMKKWENDSTSKSGRWTLVLEINFSAGFEFEHM